MDATTLTLGLLTGFLAGQACFPLLRSAPPPTPEPPAEPERDPGWCHSHGIHRDEEED
jgi:hypothetical protein